MGEFDYIAWIRSQHCGSTRVIVGPGDDCAVLSPFSRSVLVTTDMLMDGTDFHLHEIGARAAGRKAMAANLSDIAAMAGVPVAAVASVALPTGSATGRSTREIAEELFVGFRDMANQFAVTIAGGDTNSWNGPLVISITVLGETTQRRPVLRSGAHPGDWVFVTGTLGGSILGHHLDFTPRVREALQLHECVPLHAMIDISDGLAADLNHILEESRCGAVIDADAIPISPAAHTLSQRTGKTPREHALGDGEDFELLLTVSPDDGARLLREQPLTDVKLTKIGECVDAGLWLLANGRRQPLAPTGWVHPLE